MVAEYCYAELRFGGPDEGIVFLCELPRGHEGEHEVIEEDDNGVTFSLRWKESNVVESV